MDENNYIHTFHCYLAAGVMFIDWLLLLLTTQNTFINMFINTNSISIVLD